MQNIVIEIKKNLEKMADSDRKKYGEKSYPTNMRIIGVKVAEQRHIVKKLSKIIKNISKNESIEIAISLLKTNIFECQQVAYEAISNDKKIMAELTLKDLQALGMNLDNWLSVDMYACLLVGHLWREKRLPDTMIKKWAKSKDF